MMKRWIVLAVVVGSLAVPSGAAADNIGVQLVQLQGLAAQWWAGYGLTIGVPYAAGGYVTQPGCDTATIESEPLPEGQIGQTMWPHDCDMHIDDGLARAALSNAPTTPKVDLALRLLGLPPRLSSVQALLCAVVIHEYGHVIGTVEGTGGIMREDLPPAPPPACITWAAPATKGAGPPMHSSGRASRRHMRYVMRRLPSR